MAYAFLGSYIVLLILCYVAGSPALASANEDIGEADDSGIEHTYPTA